MTAALPAGPGAAELRRWIRTRRVRAARGRWSGDGVYTVVLSVIFAVVGGVTAVRGLAAGDRGTTVLPVAALAAAALLLWAAATAGPLGLAPPTLMWVATGPVRRRDLLLPRLIAVLAAGAGAGLLPVLVAGTPQAALLTVGAAAGTALAGLAAAAQSRLAEPGVVLRAAAAVTGAGALAVAWAGPRSAVPHPGPPVVAAAVLVAAAVAVLAVAGLDRTRIGALQGAASSAAVLTGGVGTADPGLLTRVAEERRWRRARLRGHLPALPGGRALAAHDALAFLRLPGRLPVALALAAIPAVLAGLAPAPGTAAGTTAATAAGAGSGAVSPVVLIGGFLIAALLAVGQTTGNVRYDADRPSPARLLGLTEHDLLTRRAAVPVVAATLWSAAAVALLAVRTGHPVVPAALLGAAAGPALAAGALRSARRSLVRHDYPLIVTPMGVVPSGPFLWLAQGVDIAALGALPLLVALARDAYGWTAVAIQLPLSVLVLAAFLARAGRPGRWNARHLLHRAVTVIWRL